VRVSAGSVSNQHQGYSESKSYNYQVIPLLRPDEVMHLPKHQILIIRSGHPPLKARQFIWYQESEMKNDVYDSEETPQHHPFIHPLSRRTELLEVLET